jgi:hypothetical protein
VSLAVAVAQAVAAEQHFYAGVGTAFSRPGIDGGQAGASIGGKWAGTPTTVDDKGDGLKLYAGWQPSRYLALELGYTDFGRVSTYSTLLGPTSRDTASVQWDGYGIDVSALGHWWVGEILSLYARGGASAWDIERKIVEDGTAGHYSRSTGDTGVSLLAGAGVAFRFMPQGTLRVEFQRYFDVGSDETGGKIDISVVSIGAHYHF